MLTKNFSNLASNSYKALCFVQHKQFLEKNIYKPLPKEFNKITMFPNLNSLMTAKTENLQFKSVVIYKFNNNKIPDILYDEKNNVFITNYIDNKAIIKYKEIHFDPNRIGEYYRHLNNLEKYFKTN